MANDIDTVISKWTKGIVEHYTTVLKECHKQAVQRLIPDIMSELITTYQAAAMAWYSAYTPRFYRRRLGLNNIYDAEANVDAPSIEYGFYEDRMTTDRAGHSLFDKVFVEGFHGGAREGGVGTPRYRTPYRVYTRWGGAAAQTKSAYEMFEENKEKIESEYKEKIKDLTLEIFSQRQ